jgi:glucose-1-phosphate cytidylyltransferase
MRTVILAGGLGTRLSEETEIRPKPMVEIGGRPVLWHILTHYAAYDFREFVVALGYKSEVIKRFFTEYSGLAGNISVELASGRVTRLEGACEDWTIHLIETGLNTNTGGRVKRLASWLREEPFMLTYGDGLSDINIGELIKAHRRFGKLATVTAVRPPARFGALTFEGDLVKEFSEKPQTEGGWINGGFFVFEPKVLDYLTDDDTSLETDCLARLAADGQLAAYRHEGFWQGMDTLRDKRQLEKMWQDGRAPWSHRA